jgi:hypothetical protein
MLRIIASGAAIVVIICYTVFPFILPLEGRGRILESTFKHAEL